MSSHFVDNLLKLLSTHGARGVRLESGRPALMVDASGSPRNVSTRALTRQEILGAIAPIVPEQARRQLPQSPVVEFEYAVPSFGDVKVRIIRDGDDLSVSLLRDGDAETQRAVDSAAAPGPASVEPATAATAPPYGRRATDRTEAPRTNAPIPLSAAPPVAMPATPQRDAPPAPRAEPAPVESAPVTTAVPGRPHVPAAAGGSSAIDRLFERMCAIQASDLHLCTGMPPLVRKDGDIRRLDEGAAPLDASAVMHLLLPIMPDKNRDEFGHRHDTDFGYELPGLARFRANVFMDRKGPGAVFRVIPSTIMTAEDLGLSPHILQLCRLNKGLVLVTGPAGSGKSTTLCALVDYINRNRTDHIITIEDPIEFVHETKRCLLNQREVHTHTDSFKDALRAALREDPDVVVVSDMRDPETVAIAIEMAEAGRLVLGTLPTTAAASTVDRIIDQFPGDRQAQIRTMLSESLEGVISQALCRRIGGGRIAALETLIVTSPIGHLIREGKTAQIPSMMQAGKAAGSVTLNDALLDLVANRLVEPREALSKAVDPSGLEALLKRSAGE